MAVRRILAGQNGVPEAVLFLDVDGVLHSLYGEEIFKEHCCHLFEHIVSTTGAAVVLSSTWREEPHKLQLINQILHERRLQPLYSSTPVLGSHRELEICTWLDENPGILRWAVVDDQDLLSRNTREAHRIASHFVRTSHELGLTDEDADKLISLLQAPGALSRTGTPTSPLAPTEAAWSDFSPQSPGPCAKVDSFMEPSMPSTLKVTLEATYARKVDLSTLAPKDKRLVLDGSGPWVIGRQVHLAFFQRLVPNEGLLNSISRRHFQVSLHGGQVMFQKLSQADMLMNGILSENSSILVNGDELALFSSDLKEPFLRLQVQVQSTLSTEKSNSHPSPDMATPSPFESILLPRPKVRVQKTAWAAGDISPDWTKHHSSFRLLLGGDAVSGEQSADVSIRVPLSGVVVGRAGQPELHMLALPPAVLKYVSREHFRVEVAKGGSSLLLTKLTSNPLWHLRAKSIEKVKTEPVLVRDGDEILLYTGAPDFAPGGRAGTLCWKVLQDLPGTGY